MNQLLATLIEEVRDLLPDTKESVLRNFSFPEAPGLINVAIGARRSGKTYLIYQKIRQLLKDGVSWQQILFINFEDDRLLPMGQKELRDLLDAFYTMFPENHNRQCYLFLDEIQNVENWPLVIRRFYDSKKVRIYLSGSSAKLLSKEIASSLRGRSISTEVWPYNFKEYIDSHEISIARTPIGKKALDQFYQHFRRYLETGGFPAVQDLYDNERRTVLQSYVDTTLFRDIVERYKITNVGLIKYLIKTLIKNIAAPFSVHKFYKDISSQGFKVSKDTVYLYMQYIEDAFLAFPVPLFTESVRKAQVHPKKIYVVDSGLIWANRLGALESLGSLFENQIYLDLRRKGCEVTYYLTKSDLEVDFVAKHSSGELELIQAVWDMSDQKTLIREKKALEEAKKELGIRGRIISYEDYLYSFLSTGSGL